MKMNTKIHIGIIVIFLCGAILFDTNFAQAKTEENNQKRFHIFQELMDNVTESFKKLKIPQ